jgi:upstream activation factor subunit UAF30
MPKKTSTKLAETESVAPIVESAAAAAPVVTEKKVKKPKAPKVETEVAAAPVVEETVTAAPTAPATTTDVDNSIIEQSTEFFAKLQQIGTMIATLKNEYKSLEKKWTRELKTAQKQTNKRKKRAGSRAPSGFVKPTRISDELASFLGKDKGSEMARTDVTREINTYIRAHKLQDKDNGRKINPDSKLASLLKLKKTDELTYFNLQKYMSPHFAKSVKTEVSASA